MLLHKAVLEDIIRTKHHKNYKPGTGIMAAIKIMRNEGIWGRTLSPFYPSGVVCGEGVSIETFRDYDEEKNIAIKIVLCSCRKNNLKEEENSVSNLGMAI